jgi:hypothetical protein
MDFEFHPEAEGEFLDAINYYENCATGLGYDFSLEVYSAVALVLAHPTAWTVLEEGIRRCLINRFPFALLYGVEGQMLRIFAVMDLRRDPDYWKSRKSR